MADRCDFYFRQRVTEAELDTAFSLLEKADRNLAADLGVFGIIAGAVIVPHEPVPDLSVDLTAPARAYDQAGQRVTFGVGQTVDCGVDWQGIPTSVSSAANERWLSIFLRFDRHLSDPRTDGNSQQVYFRRDESFQVLVRQAAEGPLGAAQRVALEPDELLLCDVRRRAGQVQVVAADLDTTRRQAFVYARASAVSVEPSFWSAIVPRTPTVQAALDATDDVLLEHLSGISRHPASQVDIEPSGFVSGSTVQELVSDLVAKLGAATTGAAGASRIGADSVPGAPWPLPAGTVDGQLAQLLALLNQHGGAVVGAHPASAIVVAPHNHLTSTTLQGQLQELVADLRANATGSAGAALVGAEAIGGSPASLPAGTVSTALGALLAGLNAHATRSSSAHPASSISVADQAGRLNAAHVEDAIGEVLDAVSAGHFLGHEAAAGQHRTIRQPPLGGLKALLWDSAASGTPATRFRVFADATAIWFTVNAIWGADAWSKDAPDGRSTALVLSSTSVELLHTAPTASPFATWTQAWRLPMSTGAGHWEVAGSTSVVGRMGVYLRNFSSTPQTMTTGGAVTFRHRLAAAPSSITLLPLEASEFSGVPSVFAVDVDGFAYTTLQTVPALAAARWTGTYLAA